jgi:hypothetical protein
LIFSEGRHFGSQFRDVPAFHEKKNFKWNRWKIEQFLRFAAWNSTVTRRSGQDFQRTAGAWSFSGQVAVFVHTPSVVLFLWESSSRLNAASFLAVVEVSPIVARRSSF